MYQIIAAAAIFGLGVIFASWPDKKKVPEVLKRELVRYLRPHETSTRHSVLLARDEIIDKSPEGKYAIYRIIYSSRSRNA